MSWIDDLERRSAGGLRIGFPEADEPRTAAAILQLAGEAGPRPVAVTDGFTPPAGLESLDLADAAFRGRIGDHVPDLGEPGSGDTLRAAVGALAAGLLDGVVAGARSTTADVLRAGLRVLGTAREGGLVSAAFYMVWPDRVLTFTDAAVVPQPSAAQLVEIADDACAARRAIVGDEPRVAFLSYATRGSAGGASVERMREAAAAFRARRPEIVSDGELQADAALVPVVAARKAPDSPLSGDANVLVFPDLDAGNIAYKLVQRLAGARAVGPILQGLAYPLNDLSRGASIEDIVLVARVTALQAAGRGAGNETENE
ncbi:MAG: phosphate acyltransferase [Gemmatimonadales bacterium]